MAPDKLAAATPTLDTSMSLIRQGKQQGHTLKQRVVDFLKSCYSVLYSTNSSTTKLSEALREVWKQITADKEFQGTNTLSKYFLWSAERLLERKKWIIPHNLLFCRAIVLSRSFRPQKHFWILALPDLKFIHPTHPPTHNSIKMSNMSRFTIFKQ